MDSVEPQDYQALVLPGGYSSSVKEFLENTDARDVATRFWALDRPVAALGRGVLILARARTQDGHSLIHNRKTTTLTKAMENFQYGLTFIKYRGLFRMYPVALLCHFKMHCMDEVATALDNFEIQLDSGPLHFSGKGKVFGSSTTER